MKYEVKIKGKTVFTEETDSEEFDREVFPEQYRGRPESGTITLLTNGEIISVSVSEEEAANMIVGAGAATQESATGSN